MQKELEEGVISPMAPSWRDGSLPLCRDFAMTWIRTAVLPARSFEKAFHSFDGLHPKCRVGLLVEMQLGHDVSCEGGTLTRTHPNIPTAFLRQHRVV